MGGAVTSLNIPRHCHRRAFVLRAAFRVTFGRGNRAGVTLNHDYTDYSFSNPVRFGDAAPWSMVQRYGVSVPLSFGLSDGWSVGLATSFDWFRENGADAGDAFTWGGIVSATKRFDNGNRLGFGMGVFDRIEETSVFPFLLVDWWISDRWRLVNPLPAGPNRASRPGARVPLRQRLERRARSRVAQRALSPEQ